MQDFCTAHTAVVTILTGGSKREGSNNTSTQFGSQQTENRAAIRAAEAAQGFEAHPASDTREAEGEWEGSEAACSREACEGGDETGGGVLELGSFGGALESRADIGGSEDHDALFGTQCSASLASQQFMCHNPHPCSIWSLSRVSCRV